MAILKNPHFLCYPNETLWKQLSYEVVICNLFHGDWTKKVNFFTIGLLNMGGIFYWDFNCLMAKSRRVFSCIHRFFEWQDELNQQCFLASESTGQCRKSKFFFLFLWKIWINFVSNIFVSEINLIIICRNS